jgi:hypothetical protein
MVPFLLLVIAALVLIILGTALSGVFYLAILGIVVFVLSFFVLGAKVRGRRPAR